MGATMTEGAIYPKGSYVTVRGGTDEWVAVVVAPGIGILSRAVFSDRSEAFSAAIRKAEREGIECLVQRGRND